MDIRPAAVTTLGKRTPFYTVVYLQVLTAIIIGVILGWVAPETGAAMRPLGAGFIKLGRRMITPTILCVVAGGSAKPGDLRAVGRIGTKALHCFEVVSTIALAIGLIVVNIIQPGVGINADPASLDAGAVASYASTAAHLSTTQFLLNKIGRA